jgi:hypothetical protein
MATQAGFDTKIFGPFGALFDSYLQTIESLGQGKLPLPFGAGLAPNADVQGLTEQLTRQMTAPLKAAARCQLEVLGLMNRRTQAYMQVPTRLAQCRTPQDFMNEQMAFWRTAAEQYRESGLKVGQAWGQAMPWLPSGRAFAERDYITFNGTSKDGGTHTTRQEPSGSGAQRRVA